MSVRTQRSWTMEHQNVTSLRSLTLGGFMASVVKNVDHENAAQIKRLMQRGVFEELWVRATAGEQTTLMRTYANVGLMASTLFQNTSGKPDAAFKKRLKNKPLIGTIRARQEFFEDPRFIMTVVGGSVYLIMDNAALDSKMPTVMIFSKDAECFVDHDALIDFAMNNDILM